MIANFKFSDLITISLKFLVFQNVKYELDYNKVHIFIKLNKSKF